MYKTAEYRCVDDGITQKTANIRKMWYYAARYRRSVNVLLSTITLFLYL